MAECQAKIRPFPNMTELQCAGDPGDGHDEHYGNLRDYAYPGSKTLICWQESDRRTFYGTWSPCPSAGCILPAGHRSNHAV